MKKKTELYKLIEEVRSHSQIFKSLLEEFSDMPDLKERLNTLNIEYLDKVVSVIENINN